MHLFSRKFRGAAGLRKLSIFGILDFGILRKFRDALLQEDGTSEAYAWELNDDDDDEFHRLM